MFCQLCGGKIPDDSKFCPACGQEVPDYVENDGVDNPSVSDEQKPAEGAQVLNGPAPAPANANVSLTGTYAAPVSSPSTPGVSGAYTAQNYHSPGAPMAAPAAVTGADPVDAAQKKSKAPLIAACAVLVALAIGIAVAMGTGGTSSKKPVQEESPSSPMAETPKTEESTQQAEPYVPDSETEMQQEYGLTPSQESVHASEPIMMVVSPRADEGILLREEPSSSSKQLEHMKPMTVLRWDGSTAMGPDQSGDMRMWYSVSPNDSNKHGWACADWVDKASGSANRTGTKVPMMLDGASSQYGATVRTGPNATSNAVYEARMGTEVGWYGVVVTGRGSDGRSQEWYQVEVTGTDKRGYVPANCTSASSVLDIAKTGAKTVRVNSRAPKGGTIIKSLATPYSDSLKVVRTGDTLNWDGASSIGLGDDGRDCTWYHVQVPGASTWGWAYAYYLG